MNEYKMRQIVVQALSGLDVMSVENPVRPGTPDVNFIEGWMELKILQEWPARKTTKVRVPCFTPQQRVWLDRRWRRGGNAYFLILVSKDWLLFNGDVAAKLIGSLNKNEMIEHSRMYSPGKLDEARLYGILKNGRATEDK